MTSAMDALNRARQAWQRTQQQTQLDLDGLDETHADTTPLPPPGGRVRLVEPNSTGSGASPTPAQTSESSPTAWGSSFRQDAVSDRAGARVPGSRHLHVVPDPRVPTPIPIPRLLEVLTWRP